MSLSRKLDLLQERIGYKFNDFELLQRALTHGSYGDGRRRVENYQRLEFLGDRVLGLFTAEILYEKSDEDEGGLARKLNALVRKETCASISAELGLGELVRMSKATEKQAGREKVSILADIAESLLGAIYLDGGIEAAHAFYKKFWYGRMLQVLNQSMKDPKTELQEKAAASRLPAPVYTVTGQSGPDHRPSFIVQVSVTGKGTGEGQGANKKDAERKAAQNLLSRWVNL